MSHYSLQPQAVSFNAWGSRGSSSDYSPRAIADNNSVASRLLARGEHVATVGLQEMCVAQSFILAAKLITANLSHRGAFKASRGGMTHDDCGTQFGNVALVNGGVVGSPAGLTFSIQHPDDTEFRNAVCVQNLFYLSCSSHVTPLSDKYPLVRYAQVSDYRDFVGFLSVLGGIGAFAAGDFNIEVDSAWYPPWMSNGFLEADAGSSQVTKPSLNAKIDFIFRRSPASWSHGAYVNQINQNPPGGVSNRLSDHYWLQGYP